VSKAKQEAYESMYENLKTNGPKNLYKLTKTRKRRAIDIDKNDFHQG
jgi:hypothetical protein